MSRLPSARTGLWCLVLLSVVAVNGAALSSNAGLLLQHYSSVLYFIHGNSLCDNGLYILAKYTLWPLKTLY